MLAALDASSMDFTDFQIGRTFRCGGKNWTCTDLGTRVVVAICIDVDDPSWLNGPPYAVSETVFDEYDIAGCEPGEEL